MSSGTILPLLQGSGAAAASPPAALLLAGLTALGMMAGVWTIRRFEGWAIHHTAELIVFAAGLLVAGALLHLVPGAVALIGGDRAASWTLGSFLVFFLLEAHFIPHVHARGEMPLEDHHAAAGPAHGHRHAADSVGPVVVVGLALHSVVDGISVGAGLSAGALLGTVTATLVVVHKLPVGIAAMSALYHSGVPGPQASWISGGLALVTPVAVVISYFALRNVSEHLLGILLALAGGSFLYVGAADLLPEGQARGRPSATLMFFAGTGVMLLVKVVAH